MPQALDYSRVADLYDSYVRVDSDVPFFVEEATAVRGEVLELTSGTGRVSLPLVEAGVRLTCVDNSPEMLAVLRHKLAARGLQAEVVEQDICALDLGRRFELVLIPFHAFSELSDTGDQRQALARIAGHLAPDGRLVVTLRNGRLHQVVGEGGLRLLADCPRDGGGRLLVWWQSVDPHQPGRAAGLELFEEYDAAGRLVGKRVADVRFRVFSRDEFAALADDAGYRVVALYGDYQRSPFDEAHSPYLVWVLRGP